MKKTIIWGAGILARRALMDASVDLKFQDIAFFIDKNKDIQNTGFDFFMWDSSLPVYDPQYIDTINHQDYSWLICVTKAEEIVPLIHSNEVKQYLTSIKGELASGNKMRMFYCMEMYEYENHFRNNISHGEFRALYDCLKSKMVIPRLVYSITEICSLNCKNCVNLMPYYKERREVDSDVIIRDTEQILGLVDEVIFFELGGGEPFLHKDLATILKYLIENNKIRNIIIITNGTAKIKDEVLMLLKNDKVIVRISDYGLSDKPYIFKSLLDEKMVTNEINLDFNWYVAGSPQNRGRSIEQLKEQYGKCHGAFLCKAVKNGKMFSCNRSLALHDICALSSEMDYIDLSSVTKKDIVEFYERDYCNGCNHCDLYSDSMIRCKAGEQ